MSADRIDYLCNFEKKNKTHRSFAYILRNLRENILESLYNKITALLRVGILELG